jgi:ankyrin repeat protein
MEVAPPALLQPANDGLAEVVAFLLAVPAIDVPARNSKEETALHCAARWNQMDVIELLLLKSQELI